MVFDAYGDQANPVLVLLHGAALLETFAHQYDLLASRFRVLVPHLPGAGDAAEEAYDPQKTADSIAEWIAALPVDKVMLMGHSVGAELAVKLVCEHEALFSRAVFLSPWLLASAQSVRLYCGIARLSYGAVKNKRLLRMQGQYWQFTPEQTDRLVTYSPRIPLETYVSFYEKRIYLSELTQFDQVNIPMLAMCARGETAETKASVRALGEQNANCLTVIFPRGSHDFVLREHTLLNPMLLDFLTA